MSTKILVVDDEADIRMLVAGILEDEGYEALEASNSDEALALYLKEKPTLLIQDIWLENSALDGLGILARIKENDSITQVIMMSGHGNIETAVGAIKEGAYDFIEKPFKSDHLLLVVKRALENYHLKQENEDLRKQMFKQEELIGTSLLMQNLRQTISKVAPTNSRILISGGPGSGKELIAKQIHLKSNRKDAPFMIINCAGLTHEASEAELFGEENNGAVTKIGILEKADGGTILLDEIQEMPISIQSKLIRLMQEDGFERVHGNRRVKSSIRFIASSSKDLLAAVKNGTLREDLYYRINVVPVKIPALKDRREDIIPIINYFLESLSTAKSKAVPNFSQEALTLMESYGWPGNVRQLKNVVEWVMIINPDNKTEISKDMLPAEISAGLQDPLDSKQTEAIMTLPLKDARDIFEKEYLQAQLRRFGDNVSKTAAFVGIERSALYRKFKSLGLDPQNEKEKSS